MGYSTTYIIAGGLGQPDENPQPRFVTPELFGEIRRLKEQADWMGQLMEDDERGFTYGEDGTIQFGQHAQAGPSDTAFGFKFAFNQCMMRPGYIACFFINEAQHRIMRARSRAFCSINPYWHGVQHNLKTHVVGTGHTWTIMPRNPAVKVDEKKIAKAQKELDDFYNAGYRQVQQEKLERKSRDGEYFLQYREERGKFAVRFIEPLLVWTPPEHSANEGVWFGIKFEGDDYETPKGYYVRRTDLMGGSTNGDAAWNRMIAADEIQHRKVNVDKSSPRGVPDTYWVQARLEQSLRTLKAMGTLVQVRAKIAMIRKRINALAGTVQPMLSASAAATIAGPGGQTHNVFDYPEGAILDTSDQAEYQFPGQNIETDKIVASVQADLQAVATSTGLADYMVSGNLGKSSFASAMVAEGPVVKTFASHQQDMIDEDQEVAARVLQSAIDAGRIDEDTLELCKVEMNGPPLARMGMQEAQANQIMNQSGVKSVTTWQQEAGLSPATERANAIAEAEHRLKMAETEGKIAALTAPPPAPGSAVGKGGATTQAKVRDTARPFSPDQEPRQVQRASGATQEEDELNILAGYYGWTRERTQDAIRGHELLFDPTIGKWRRTFQSHFTEHSSDDRGQEKPTQEDMGMASRVFPPQWLEKTKMELAMLIPPPPQEGVTDEYEPGVKAAYLGVVDGQKVYAVDMTAMMILHDAPDLVVAGNSEKWHFVRRDTVIVDWSYKHIDDAHCALHELCEQALMSAGWAYARAHRFANNAPGMETDYILSLRPELAALKARAPKE